MVQSFSGFAKFLQPPYCFFSADKFSGNTVSSVTPAQQYFRRKKIAFSTPLFSAHSTTQSVLSLRTECNEVKQSRNERSEVAPRAENCPTKHFLHTLHTAVFPAAFQFRYSYEDFRWVRVSNPTIFLRVCFPGLPPLFQVSAVNSRHSL